MEDVEKINVMISTYRDDAMGDLEVYPDKGTVCFSASLHKLFGTGPHL